MRNRDNYTDFFKSNFNKIAFFLAFYGMLHSNLVFPAQNLIYVLSNINGLTTGSMQNSTNDYSYKESKGFPTTYNGSDIIDKETGSLELLKYIPDINGGIIGIDPELNLDNAEDNYFNFFIAQSEIGSYSAFLTYDLFGIDNVDAVSRSINGRFSCGGYLAKLNTNWTSHSEELNSAWLKTGKNTISFAIDKNSGFFYKIKNVRINLVRNANKDRIVIPNNEFLVNDNNEVYIKGFVREYDASKKILINGVKLNCYSGEFEGFYEIDNLKHKELTISLYENDAKIEERTIKIKSLTKADFNLSITKPNLVSTKIFEPDDKISEWQFEGAKITILPNSIKEQTQVSISQLRPIDIAPLNPELINVTKNSSAYRFTPDGFKFDSLVKISLNYDPSLIPSGYSPADIRTYYFNTNTKKWEEIVFDSIDKVNNQIVSKTDHFTDYINGIVQVPESPQNSAFVPTMMNDIKIADPASNITLINPPAASQTGEAAITYPIKVPSGRQGIQPDLTLQYNSNGGSGWLGQGWNIPIPAITIDTRWGVPNLNNSTETEIYTLNGEQLMYPKIEIGGELVDWMPNRHYGKDGVLSTEPRNKIGQEKAYFTFRKQGDFSRIQRMGDSPATYYWKVVQSDGTIYWYGGKSVQNVNDNLAVIKNESGGVVYWALFCVEDVHGNFMEYTYDQGNVSQEGALSGGHYFYPSTIKYTGNIITNKSPKYEVRFNLNKQLIRTDATIDAKLGLKHIDPYYLNDIKIYYNTRDTIIRGYRFDFSDGRFGKSLLNSVTETDANNDIFYTHTFEYYDDIKVDGNDVYYTKGEEFSACDDKCFHTKINIPDTGNSYFYHYSFDINYEQLRTSCSNLSAARFGYLILNNDTIRPVPDNQYLTHYTDSLCNLCPATINYNQSPGDPCVQNTNFVSNFTNWISSALSSVMPENISFTNQSGVYNYDTNTVSNVSGLQGGFTSKENFNLRYVLQFPFDNAKDYYGGAVQTIDSIWSAADITISISSSAGIESFGPYSDFFNPAVIEQFENDLRQKYEGYPYPEVTTSETTSVEIDFPATDLDFYSITVTSLADTATWPFTMCYEGTSKSFDPPIKAEKLRITNLPPLKSSFDNSLLQRYNIRSLSSKANADTCNPITNIRFKFPINTPSFKKVGSLLGGTAGYTANVGGYVGIGIGKDFMSKTNTLGLQVNYGWNRNETFTTLEDIDGDGLDDIIIKKGELLVYKKHSIVNNTHQFSPGKPLFNLDNIFKQTGKSLSGNLQGTCKLGFGGIDYSFNWSETSVYLTDANNDGLLDVARDGVVYFNQFDESGNITFNKLSDNTENMIITGAARTENIPGQILQDSINYPVCDVVKIWEAPADGKITIYDTIQLLDPEKPSQVTIEKVQRNGLCYNSGFPIPTDTLQYYEYSPYIYAEAYPVDGECDPNTRCLIRNINVNSVPYYDINLYLTHWDLEPVDLCSFCPSDPIQVNTLVECTQNLEFENNFRDYLTNIFNGNPFYGSNFTVDNKSGVYYAVNKQTPYGIYTGFVNVMDFSSTFTSLIDISGTVNASIPSGQYYPQFFSSNFLKSQITTTTTIPCQIWIFSSAGNNYLGTYDFSIQSEVERFQSDLNAEFPSSSPIIVTKINNNIQVNIADPDLEFRKIYIENINQEYPFEDCSRNINLASNYVNDYELDSLELQLAIKKSIAAGDVEKLPITDFPEPMFSIQSDSLIDIEGSENLSKLSKEIFIKSLKELRKQSKEEAQAWLEKYYNTTRVIETPDENNFNTPIFADKTTQPTNLSLLYGTTLRYGQPIINEIETIVKKGDTIFFRTHSVENGNSPVQWNPQIEYVNQTLQNITDQNGIEQYISSYSDGFILSANDTIHVKGTGEAFISWPRINVNNLSDQVTFKIDRTDEEIDPETGEQISYTSSNIFLYDAPAGGTSIPDMTSTVTTQTLGGPNVITSFSFKVYSNSNVDWKKIEWHPYVSSTIYEEIIGMDNIVEDTLESTETKFPIVDYDIYKLFTESSSYSNFNLGEMGGDNIIVTPELNGTFNLSDNGLLFLTVKCENNIVGTIRIIVYNGTVLCQPTSLNLGNLYNEDIEISYWTDDSQRKKGERSLLETLVNKVGGIVKVHCNTSGLNRYLNKDQVNLYHKPRQQFGPMYRNWGQFMYNPSVDPSPVPLQNGLTGNFINTSLLKITEAEELAIQSAEGELNGFSFNIDDTTAFKDNMAVLFDDDTKKLANRPFIQARAEKSLNGDELFQKWIGVHEECYASAICARAADYSQTYTGYINEQILLTQLGDIKTGAYSIPKKSEGSSTNLSAGIGIISASKSISGKNSGYSDYFDINGDGYPEIVTKDEVQKSTRTGGLNSPIDNSFGALTRTKSSSEGFSACNSFAISGEDETTANTKPNASAGISGSLSSGEDKTTILWFDINGDGLPDKYQRTANGINIELNNGTGFIALNWPIFNASHDSTYSKGGGIGVNLKKGSIESGFSISNCLSSSNSTLQDFNGDGLVDLFMKAESGFIDVYLNTGTSFAADPIKLQEISLIENSESVSNSLNAGFSLSLIWPLFLVTIKAPCININGQYAETNNRTKKVFKDFDGDGYVDYLEEIDPKNIKVYYSRIARTNKLKKVTNPLNGSFSIDYKANLKSYDNPNSLWVMSELQVNDGLENMEIAQHGKSVYTKRFSYEGGKYDRRERTFLGFKKVITHDIEASNEIYRSQASEYLNESYFTQNLIKTSKVYKKNDEKSLYSSVTNEYVVRGLTTDTLPSGTILDNMAIDLKSDLGLLYDVGGKNGKGTAAVMLLNTVNDYYNESDSPLITSRVEFEYDSLGRISRYSNFGDVNDDKDNYISDIHYYKSDQLREKNIQNVSDTIAVKIFDATTSTYKLKRKRHASNITNTGLVKTITTDISGEVIGGGTTILAVTDMDYDANGNIKSITFPENENLERVSYAYTYDTENAKYITGIKDVNLEYETSMFYNPKFDVVSSVVDITGNETRYYYDAKGRLTRIVGPNEIKSGVPNPYTIKFEYLLQNPCEAPNFVPLAITQHFDIQGANDAIETYNFVDGLGRVIQVKKDIVVNTAVNHTVPPAFVQGMSVTGWTSYDEFGRKTDQYLPTWESSNDCKVKAGLNIDFVQDKSSSSYDQLDRPLVLTDPELHTTSNAYSFEDRQFKTKTSIQKDSLTEVVKYTLTDLSGNITKSVNSGDLGDYITIFDYNAIGELMTSTDPSGLLSRYYYDNRGLTIGYSHPDMGLTTFKYDKAGNIVSKDSRQFDKIDYKYQFNQLVNIFYPSDGVTHNISNVTYQYGTASDGNEAGRIIKQTDATGSQEFRYGNMGEVIYNNRTIQYGTYSNSYATQFTYDSWNRINQIIYPDGEEVNYYYNAGGNIYSIVNNDSYAYVARSDYNYFGELAYQKYGNNTETVYSYTDKLRRLNSINVNNSSAQILMSPIYSYDYIGNITAISNQGTTIGSFSTANAQYDLYNRLISAGGSFANPLSHNSSTYNLAGVVYGSSGEILEKNQSHILQGNSNPLNTYNNQYDYISSSHKISQIKDQISGRTESGLYYYGARYYDPRISVWMSVDVII